jgi:hypothetical protein
MLKYFVPLFLSFVFCNCNSDKTGKELSRQSLPRVDTVFLGFRFGSSLQEFSKLHKSLLSRGVLSKDGTGSYFQATLDEHSADLTKAKIYILNPDFEQDELYKLNLKVIPNGIYNHKGLIKASLNLLLLKKYIGRTEYQYKDEESKQFFGDTPDYKVLVGSNLQISIMEGLDGILVEYLDLPVRIHWFQKRN